MMPESDAEEREKLTKRRRAVRSQMGKQCQEFNRMAMVVKVKDPYGTKTLGGLKGAAPRVSSTSWITVLKTLSIDGLCRCLAKLPKYEKYLRKAIVTLIVIKRLELLDKRIANLLTQLETREVRQ